MGTTVPSWVIWVPLIGTILGGLVTYLITARTSRVGARSQFIGQWVSEVRKVVIELTGELDAIHAKLFREPMNENDSVKIMKHTTTLTLYLDPGENRLHAAALAQIQHVTESFKPSEGRAYAEELAYLTMFFREVIKEELRKIDNEVSLFWQSKRERADDLERALERYDNARKLQSKVL